MRFSLKMVLCGAIGLLALAAAGQGVVSVVRLSEIEQDAKEVSQVWLPAQNQAEAIGMAVRDVRLKLYKLVVGSPDFATLDKNQTALTDGLGALSELRQAYQDHLSTPRERETYERFTGAWNAYQNIQLQVVELMIAGDTNGALKLVLDPETGAQSEAAVGSLAEAIALARSQTDANVVATADTAASAKRTALVATAVGLLVAASAMLFALFGIARPIQRMTGAMGRLAEGDATVAIPGTGRRDEIGAMAAAVQVFKDNLIHTHALEQETALARAGAEAQRRRAVVEMANGFEAAIGGVLAAVTEAALDLRANAETMTSTATRTAERSAAVASAAQEAAAHVGTVAVAAEELGASVQEIGRQVDGSADLARGAVAQAGQTAG
ncbi:MCP four helix bundle domain-containing protein, partial [Methylobacterium sp. J-048]|uniref:MCP four helix bundle domain-containing protein n=1 Tax=Methylobacterium sp. J-048 TaxID=2836635 RepID=UPI001FB99FB5